MGNNLWILGAALCVFASGLSTFGINLQKYSHLQSAESLSPGQAAQPYYLRGFWWAGFLLIIFGTLMDVVALAFAAQSLVAPLAGLSLVFNVLLAPCFLDEVVTRIDLIATGVILLGCTMAVAFADHEHTSYNFDDIVDKANNAACWTYFLSALVAIATCYFFIQRFEGERIDDSHWYQTNKKWHSVSYALLAGTAGSVAVTCAKAAAELIKAEINNPGVGSFEKHWFAAPAAIVVLVTMLIFQIHFLNAGLERFDVLLIVPMYQGFWIILTAGAGMVTYREYENFGVLEGVFFPMGVIVTLVGVYIMSLRPQRYSLLSTTDDDDFFTADEETKGSTRPGSDRISNDPLARHSAMGGAEIRPSPRPKPLDGDTMEI